MSNLITDYYTKIVNKEILVNDLVKAQYDILANASEQPGEFHYDENIAMTHIDFMQNFCKQSQGVMGAPILFEPFQLAAISSIYGFVDDDNLRQYREMDWFMGRKNGKTTVSSCMSLDGLCNDGEGAPEIYFLATKMDQARKGYDEANRMRKQSPFLIKHIRKRGSDIYFPGNEGIMKPLASDVKKLDSYNSSMIFIDELGAIQNRSLYDDMKQSTYSRRQPLLCCISTNNFVRNGIYDDQVDYGTRVLNGTIKDKRFLFLYYALQKKEQWRKPKYWIMANPGLGTIKSYDQLASNVEKAKVDKASRPTVLVKDFNIPENQNTSWLDYEEAINGEKIDMEMLLGAYCIGGADMSATTDLTCATLLIPKNKKLYVLQQYFIPETKLEKVESQEIKEAPYKLWSDLGWVTVCHGAQVDFHDVTLWFASMVEKYQIRPLWIGYDRALAGYWASEMESYGFTMETIRQGPFTWTYPFKMLKGEFMSHNVIYDKNPVLMWCLTNTGVKSTNSDGIDSQQPVKIQQHRRIDGTVSLLNAYTCLKNHEEEFLSIVG